MQQSSTRTPLSCPASSRLRPACGRHFHNLCTQLYASQLKESASPGWQALHCYGVLCRQFSLHKLQPALDPTHLLLHKHDGSPVLALPRLLLSAGQVLRYPPDLGAEQGWHVAGPQAGGRQLRPNLQVKSRQVWGDIDLSTRPKMLLQVNWLLLLFPPSDHTSPEFPQPFVHPCLSDSRRAGQSGSSSSSTDPPEPAALRRAPAAAAGH